MRRLLVDLATIGVLMAAFGVIVVVLYVVLYVGSLVLWSLTH